MAKGQELDAGERLDALARSVLLDTPAEEAFDRATRLASRLIGAPVALVSIVDRDRQFFKSQLGLPEPWATERQTPLSHSFCQHVVTSGEVLRIPDAREDARVSDNLAIRDLDVVAYLGVPITDPDDNVLGSFCVIDSEPRDWTAEEQTLLADIAAQVRSLIALRVTLGRLERATRERDDLMAMITHDLRGPITNIRAAADMVSTLPPDEQEPFVGVIVRAAERMEALVSGLVASERAGLPSRVRDIDIAATIRAVAERHPQRHRLELQAPMALRLATDRDAAEQITANLLDDALQRAPEGSTVRVSLRASVDGIDLYVRDDGQLSDERLQALLEQHEVEPAGLGLPMHIVKRLVAALGGRLDAVVSEDGTTLTVELTDLMSRVASEV